MTNQEIVAKLWNLCNVLRDDGITYHQYVTELTYILFLKMAKETGTEDKIPEKYRWDRLVEKDGLALKKFYEELLRELGENCTGRIQEIYLGARSNIEEPANLKKIITNINDLDWYSAKEEGLGNLYEGLLEKNANEKKSGAGQYFTPRVLIDIMTELIAPQPGERCNDPACGTFGFMIAADAYVKAHTDDLFSLTSEQQAFQKNEAFTGAELVHETHPIPVSVEGYGLVYNKEIFKDAGIDASTLTSYDAIDKAFADLQNQIDSGKLKDKYPQLEAVEEYAAKETWIPGLHTLNAPLACEYSSATELRNSDQLGLKYADSLKALLDLETKYTTSKDDLSKLNAVDYSSEIGGGLAIERVAVVQQGNWIGPELSGIDEEVANKMGILPIPLKGVKEDCIPTGISIYWCINSQSGDKEKEASKEFLKWLFQSDEGKQIVVNDFGFVPAFNNYDDVEITDTLSKEVKRYIDEGKTLPWVMGGFPSGYEPKAAADFQGYFSGEYTFDQMVDQLKADFVELKK